jgi:hypothetical protein
MPPRDVDVAVRVALQHLFIGIFCNASYNASEGSTINLPNNSKRTQNARGSQGLQWKEKIFKVRIIIKPKLKQDQQVIEDTFP